MLIDKILKRGDVLNVSSKSIASFQVLIPQIALAVANGVNVLGFGTTETKVLLVDARGVRLEQVIDASGASLDNLTIAPLNFNGIEGELSSDEYGMVAIHSSVSSTPQNVQRLEELAKRHNVGVVCRLERYWPTDCDLVFTKRFQTTYLEIETKSFPSIEPFPVYFDGLWRQIVDVDHGEGIALDYQRKVYIHKPTGAEFDIEDYHTTVCPLVTAAHSAYADCLRYAKVEAMRGGSD